MMIINRREQYPCLKQDSNTWTVSASKRPKPTPQTARSLGPAQRFIVIRMASEMLCRIYVTFSAITPRDRVLLDKL
jgi:hypothetical protein